MMPPERPRSWWRRPVITPAEFVAAAVVTAAFVVAIWVWGIR